MEKPKKSVGLSYFMPGIVLLFVIGILFLILLCIPIYIYVTTTLVALLLHRLFFKKAVLHPWHLSPEEIEDSKRISVCVVGAGFSGLCMAIKLKKAGINFRFDFKYKSICKNYYPCLFRLFSSTFLIVFDRIFNMRRIYFRV